MSSTVSLPSSRSLQSCVVMTSKSRRRKNLGFNVKSSLNIMLKLSLVTLQQSRGSPLSKLSLVTWPRIPLTMLRLLFYFMSSGRTLRLKPLITLHRNPSKRNVIACLTERDGELVIEPMYVSKGMRSQTTANK